MEEHVETSWAQKALLHGEGSWGSGGGGEGHMGRGSNGGSGMDATGEVKGKRKGKGK